MYEGNRNRLGTIVVGSIILLISFSPTRSSTAFGLSNSGMSPHFNLSNEEIICASIDIRNSLDNFRDLENCTVVEGFVQILLFDNVEESEFKNISFPKLTEITDFLLLYRVNGLRSVGQLFPNLAVIRGQNKVIEYSLIIYEMSNLQDIGLYSLKEISSGLVRIDKNPSLCFVRTIKWELIALEQGDHFIKNIRSQDECPLCPGEDVRSNISCPHNPHQCWNRDHCQVICPNECKNSCDANGKCCGPNCIGCKDDQPNECLVCRHVVAGLSKCMENCPRDFYKHLDRRCVTKAECISQPRPILLTGKPKQDRPYRILGDKCVLECPPNYSEKDNECELCKAGRCNKECPGIVIDSLNSAKELQRCTHINGSLEIQIRGGKNVVNKLEEYLGMIEEIDGYLKIVRSFPLISLSFLKKLTRIHGRILESNKYVFFVLDNQNLQDIWNWANHTLTIDRGKLFFHYNPRLCLSKIRTLQERTNVPDYNELEVASNSNGDKIACNITKLAVVLTHKDSHSIVLTWEKFEMYDHRKLLGYIVYSIQAPHNNITVFDGRDACGADGWRVDDIPITKDKQTYLLTQLEAFTQYAVYVKTYTIASEQAGAQSDILYFTTAAGKPSMPRHLSYENKNLTTHLTWKPPLNPNGIITSYIVTGNIIPQPMDPLVMRDYCSMKPKTLKVNQPLPTIKENETCECTDETDNIYGPPKPKLKNPAVVDDEIKFENDLYNFVYKKREETHSHILTKRSLDNLFMLENHLVNQTALAPIIDEDTKNTTDWKKRFLTFRIIVDNRTDVFIPNLVHYKQYSIYVQACRQREYTNDNNDTCSPTAKIAVSTESKEHVDIVPAIQINNITYDSAVVIWDKPLDPNGNIESYHITYGLVDDNDPHNQTQCISVTGENFTTRYELKRLKAGNWSIQMSVTTQAGPGRITKVYYFEVKQPVNVLNYVLPIVLLLILVALGIFYKFGYKCIRREDEKLFKSINPDYIPTDYVVDDWEVPRDRIKLLKELGQGSFGMVYEGIGRDIKGRAQVKCAIKTVNEHATNRERIEFLNEATKMKEFDTTHVVKLLGVVSQGQPTLVIMELMANGDLKTYLRSHRPDGDGFVQKDRKPPNLKMILQMAIEIADGMAYLSANKFVHRDLAARNCMVSDNLTVKIGDFGMTRDIYETDYYRKGTKGLLPVRWMAPESLKDGLFTSSSDVWSYGIVLWEMATLASQPYQGLTNEQVLRYTIGGNIMERPEKCPDILYDLMKRCWNYKPIERPTFLRLCDILMDDAREGFDKLSFYHSAAGDEARGQSACRSPSLDDATIPLRSEEENFSDNESDHAAGDTNLKFINYPSMTNLSSTANGYVSNRASNGTNA